MTDEAWRAFYYGGGVDSVIVRATHEAQDRTVVLCKDGEWYDGEAQAQERGADLETAILLSVPPIAAEDLAYDGEGYFDETYSNFDPARRLVWNAYEALR